MEFNVFYLLRTRIYIYFNNTFICTVVVVKMETVVNTFFIFFYLMFKIFACLFVCWLVFIIDIGITGVTF